MLFRECDTISDLILRSRALGAASRRMAPNAHLAAILRDASLRDAPQDEGLPPASRLKPTDRALILLCHAPKKLSIFFVVTELDPVIHPLIGTLARMDGYAGQAL
jgi:hypothetical protein